MLKIVYSVFCNKVYPLYFLDTCIVRLLIHLFMDSILVEKGLVLHKKRKLIMSATPSSSKVPSETPAKEVTTTTILSQFCYPTLVIVPVAISIIILIFAELTLFYKIAIICLLALTLFMYFTQQTNWKLFCKTGKSADRKSVV